MKKNKLLLGLIGMLLVSCEKHAIQSGPSQNNSWTQINFTSIGFSDNVKLQYTTVTLDGNEYYACVDMRGYISLCPKLPSKTEK